MSEKLPSRSTGRRGRWNISLRGLLMLVALVAVALGLWLQYRQARENRRLVEENRRLSEEAAELRYDLDLERIGALLKVPTEALYHDYMPRGELDRIRWKALEEGGVNEEFVPIYYLFAHTRNHPGLHRFRRQGRSIESWKTLQDSFWEGYAINHADDGASRLVGMLKHDTDFRSRLTADHETVEQYLKPLLLRMVKSPNRRARHTAIEALLLLGDRSDEVLEVLRRSIDRPDVLPGGANFIERANFYGWDPAQARRLVEEYQLEALMHTRLE